MKIQKLLKKPLWITLSSVFTVLFIGLIIGGTIADSWKKTISDFFGVKTYRLETIETDEEIDAEYYKSKYVQKGENGEILYTVDAETKYKHQLYDDIALHNDGIKYARQVQREGTTILWNNTKNSNVQGIPLTGGSKLSIFGQTSVIIANSGRGSGQTSPSYATNFDALLKNEGFSVNPTLWKFYKDNPIKHPTDSSKNWGASYDYPYKHVFSLPWSSYPSDVKNSFSSYGDAAIVVVTRVSGEYEDCYQNGANTISGDYLGISAEEKTMIEEVIKLKQNGTFKKVVMLLNTATSVRFKDFQPYQSDIDACVWMGQGGAEGLSEVAKILKGTSIPSGHLPDTFVFDGKSSPASVNSKATEYSNIPTNHGNLSDITSRWSKYLAYAEGIYVGYKYYETRYEDAVLNRYNATSKAGAVNSTNNWKYSEEVAYPFGYGLSYTSFEYSDYKVTKNQDNSDYTVTLTVTNTGNKVGADAVQIYIQKPYTDYDRRYDIEQASINLCGFAKTKELEPNESVTVTIKVKDDAFKTYDANNKETYILEKGEYFIAAGQDSHNAINNILAKKGKTPANTGNRMDAAGNADLVHKIEIKENDYETYAKSSTDYQITNQFNDTDWNKSDYVSRQTQIQYLSREDWEGTYPQKIQLRFHSEMLTSLSGETNVQDDFFAEMPLYEQEHQFNLIDMRGLEYDNELWEILLNQLSLEEMVEMIGSAYHGNGPIESIASPGEISYDGPMGVRQYYLENGKDIICMSFPIAPLLGATFNAELAHDVGVIKGEDIMHVGYNTIYGTGANIHRTAYGGRAYEYYSEDGFLSGIMCKEETIGIQECGSIVNIKHFALNDQDDNRYGAGVWANEQSIREIYLEAFRPAVEEGKAKGIMSSFARFGTRWSGTHQGLNNEVLRKEWGFDGYVISDCPFLEEYMNVANGLAGGTDCILYELNDSQKSPYYLAKENATVAQLVRQATHRVLYVIVNSNAMNGITANTRIIPVMTWWQATILGAQIGFGLFAAASITILVLCFVLKKKEEGELVLVEGDGNIDSIPEDIVEEPLSYRVNKVNGMFEVSFDGKIVISLKNKKEAEIYAKALNDIYNGTIDIINKT